MPSFPKKLLADHETIVFDLKPHWVALLKPVLWILLWLAVWYFGDRAATELFEDTDWVGQVVGVIAVAGLLYFGVFPIARWETTRFVLTTDRLITRWGVVSKHSKEIPLERINDVAFSQSVVERIVGAGDLMIESGGERGQSRISNVRNPEHIQLLIYKESEGNAARGPHGAAPAPSDASADEVLERIEALGRLKAQGTISDAEFEAKKQELLKRL
ncbi:MAG TPA: PH domain-containing protein [Actinomycetota bacterium]|nr:PH domain-containing protein [Actinomycetota bacterium]